MRKPEVQVKERRTLKGWTIQRCPECHGMVQGATVEHLGDCSNRESAFVVEMVEVVPLSVVEALAAALVSITRVSGKAESPSTEMSMIAQRALDAYRPADQLRKEET